MNILITICARGGSKGIPGKNIKKLGGKPLIAYTIETACKFQEKYKAAHIGLSTDSLEILKTASEYGLQTEYKRPDYLAGDNVGKLAAIKDILMFQEEKYNIKYDYLIDMDVTSPLRNLEDLECALKILREDANAWNVFSVSRANRNPYFNMVEKKDSAYYNVVKSGEGVVLTRQSSPEVYDMNASFYIYSRSFFEQGKESAITEKSLIYLVPHVCFDLDHPLDFEFMSYLIEQDKLDFQL